MSVATFQPKTRAEIKLKTQQIREIATATGIPLNVVYRYIDQIIHISVQKAIQETLPKIHEWVPKATGQLRESLDRVLRTHSSAGSYYGSGRMAQLTLGTLVPYIKYVAHMPSSSLRHPKSYGTTMIFRYIKGKRRAIPVKQNAKILGATDGARRYVHYYGAPRWVKLDDPKATKNFFYFLVMYMRKKLQKFTMSEISRVVPAQYDRREFTRRMQVKDKH